MAAVRTGGHRALDVPGRGGRPVLNVLYVLHGVAGGATEGTRDVVRIAKGAWRSYAVAPRGGAESLRRLRAEFAEVREIPLPSWNLSDDLDVGRRLALQVGRIRHGATHLGSVRQILRHIDRWGIDIVHTGTVNTLAGALAARIRNKPHVWHIKERIGWANRVHFPLPDRALVRLISGLSARVVVMSEYVAEPFRAHGVEVAVVPDGVSLEAFDRAPLVDLRKQLGVRPDQYLVAMVASLTAQWKRHDLFLRVALDVVARRDDVVFALVGPQAPASARWPHDSSRRYLAGLRHLAEQAADPSRVLFVPLVPDPPSVMRAVDLIVHTCDVEPFGRIGIEAMAAGRPVVGHVRGGLAEQIVPGVTGLLVDVNDHAILVEAVGRLLDDPRRMREMGAAGRTRVAEAFTNERHVARLRQIYEEIAGPGGAAARGVSGA